MILIFFLSRRGPQSPPFLIVLKYLLCIQEEKKSLTHHTKKIFDLSQEKRSLTHQILWFNMEHDKIIRATCI